MVLAEIAKRGELVDETERKQTKYELQVTSLLFHAMPSGLRGTLQVRYAANGSAFYKVHLERLFAGKHRNGQLHAREQLMLNVVAHHSEPMVVWLDHARNHSDFHEMRILAAGGAPTPESTRISHLISCLPPGVYNEMIRWAEAQNPLTLAEFVDDLVSQTAEYETRQHVAEQRRLQATVERPTAGSSHAYAATPTQWVGPLPPPVASTAPSSHQPRFSTPPPPQQQRPPPPQQQQQRSSSSSGGRQRMLAAAASEAMECAACGGPHTRAECTTPEECTICARRLKLRVQHPDRFCPHAPAGVYTAPRLPSTVSRVARDCQGVGPGVLGPVTRRLTAAAAAPDPVAWDHAPAVLRPTVGDCRRI